MEFTVAIAYRNDLDLDGLRRRLAYDPMSGAFTKLAPGISISTKPNSTGYLRISVDKVSYKAHRLAWLLVHGDWPPAHLDHVNGDKQDNRLANLRPATHQQNKQNVRRQRNNSSGFKGVYLHSLSTPENPRWVARIKWDGRQRHLGCFDTAEEAAEAYRRAAEKAHGPFANFDETNLILRAAAHREVRRRAGKKGTVFSVKDGTAWVAQYRKEYIGYYSTREMAELALAQHLAEIEKS